MPSLEVATAGVNVADAFGAGRSAMNTNGSAILEPAMEQVMAFDAPTTHMVEVNEQVNAFFQQ